MAYDPISRRMFLRGLGTTLTIPLLPSLLPKAHAATAQVPIRFVGITVNNGQNQDRWFPYVDAQTKFADHVYYNQLSQSISQKGQISDFIGPEFNSLQSKITIMRGLDCTSSFDAVHTTSNPFGGSGMLDIKDVNSTPWFPYTIDAIMENSAVIYPMAPRVRAFRVAPGDAGSSTNVRLYAWNKVNGTPTRLPYVQTPQEAFNKLFTGGLPTGMPARSRPSLVIDMVREDFNNLIGSRSISSVDKANLQDYVDRITNIQKAMMTVPTLSAACKLPSAPTPTSVENLYSIHFDIIVAALACNLTRVVNLHMDQWGTSEDWATYHKNAHDNKSDAWMGYSRWRALRVAEFMTKLNSAVDIDGKTVLDNSMVMWTNEMGESAQHQSYSIPVMVAGSAGGQLRTGYYIDYRQRPQILCSNEWVKIALGRPYNQLLVTALQTMGLQPADYERDGQQGFGDYTHLDEPDASALRPFTVDRRSPLPYYKI